MKISTQKFLLSASIVLLFILLLSPVFVKADLVLNDNLSQFQTGAGIGQAKIGTVVGKVTKAVLSILGLVALIIFIFAGFQWMTSGGNKEKIQGAQKLMSSAVIGLVIIILAYAIVIFVVDSLSTVTNK